jgi:hypothetical protein
MNNDAYAAALAEIEEGRLDKGAWARALAESGGDDSKAKSRYIKARAELKSDSSAWPDTQPPVEDAPKHHTKSARAPTISLSEQKKLYEPALGEKNFGYYLAKFQAFDDKGTGLHVSWNWPAFFFTGFWALYRKMYGWFFAWWALATVVTVFEKAQSAQIHQFLAVVSVVSWLGFATYANSLYHRKIKKRIASAQRSHSDVSRISGILSASSGVNKWVPIVCGAVPVIGVVASIALPAYQDYTKREVVATVPIQTPVPQLDSEKALTALTPATPSQINDFLDGESKPAQTGQVQRGAPTPVLSPSKPTESELNEQRRQAEYEAQVKLDLERASEAAVKRYPYLDTPDGERTLQKIVEKRNLLISQGVYPSIALTQAVNDYAPFNAPRAPNLAR